MFSATTQFDLPHIHPFLTWGSHRILSHGRNYENFPKQGGGGGKENNKEFSKQIFEFLHGGKGIKSSSNVSKLIE